jgi:glyoxylase-like metal-dependent hydrolase (beta-lactamase superfamily II)
MSPSGGLRDSPTPDAGETRRLTHAKHLRAMCASIALCLAFHVALAQDAALEVHRAPLRGNLQMLHGEGSNIILSTGADGTLLVDDEYASLGGKLRAVLQMQNALPVKVVINTHFHNDHTGNNESFGRDGARIIAQQRAGERLHTEQTMSLYGKQAAYPPIAWPATSVKKSLRLRWNGERIDLLHIGPAHTDGDLVVFFRKQNVLATGDLFVTGDYMPPYFDDLNGGSAEGMILAADRLLKLANDRTLIVPGHGPATDRNALQRYRDQFVAIRSRIRDAIAGGMSEDAVVAMHPGDGFAIAPRGRGTDRWVRILYREYRR